MARQHTMEWHLKSDPYKVRQVVCEVLRCLDELLPGQTQEDRGDLRLIFNELLYNAVIHGNGADTEKNVHIRLKVDGSLISASIADEGQGYNYQGIVEQSRTEDNFQKETGRGLRLVLALADEIRFAGGGSRVTFIKKVGGGRE